MILALLACYISVLAQITCDSVIFSDDFQNAESANNADSQIGCADYFKVNGLCFSTKNDSRICHWENKVYKGLQNADKVDYNDVFSSSHCLKLCINAKTNIASLNKDTNHCFCTKNPSNEIEQDSGYITCEFEASEIRVSHLSAEHYACSHTQCWSSSNAKELSIESVMLKFGYAASFLQSSLVTDASLLLDYHGISGKFQLCYCYSFDISLKNFTCQPLNIEPGKDGLQSFDVTEFLELNIIYGDYPSLKLLMIPLEEENRALLSSDMYMFSAWLVINIVKTSTDEDAYLFFHSQPNFASYRTGIVEESRTTLNLKFWLYMAGKDAGFLAVWYICESCKRRSVLLLHFSGHQKNEWDEVSVEYFTTFKHRIKILVLNDRGPDSQIAIDNLSIETASSVLGRCEFVGESSGTISVYSELENCTFWYIEVDQEQTIRLDISYNFQRNNCLFVSDSNDTQTFLPNIEGFVTFYSTTKWALFELNCDLPHGYGFTLTWTSSKLGYFEEQEKLMLPKPTLLFPLGNGGKYIYPFDHGVYARNLFSTFKHADSTNTNKYGFPVSFVKFYSYKLQTNFTSEITDRLNTNFTVSFQFKIRTEDTFSEILEVGTSDDNDFLAFSLVRDGSLEIRFKSKNNQKLILSEAIQINMWYFITLVFNGLVFTVHVNNVEHTYPREMPFNPFASTLTIYGYVMISCVQIYDQALQKHVVPAIELCPNLQKHDFHRVQCVNEGVNVFNQRKCNCPEHQRDFVGENCEKLYAQRFHDLGSHISFDHNTNKDETGFSIPESFRSFTPVIGVVNMAASFKETATLYPSSSNINLQFWFYLKSSFESDFIQNVLHAYGLMFYVNFTSSKNSTLLKFLVSDRANNFCSLYVSTDVWYYLEVHHAEKLEVYFDFHKVECLPEQLVLSDSPVGDYNFIIDELITVATSDYTGGYKSMIRAEPFTQFASFDVLICSKIYYDAFNGFPGNKYTSEFQVIQKRLCSIIVLSSWRNGPCEILETLVASEKCKSPHIYGLKVRLYYTFIYYNVRKIFLRQTINDKVDHIAYLEPTGCVRVSCLAPTFTAEGKQNQLIINVTSKFDALQKQFNMGYFVAAYGCTVLDNSSCDWYYKRIGTAEYILFWNDYLPLKRMTDLVVCFLSVHGCGPITWISTDILSSSKTVNYAALGDLYGTNINSTCALFNYSIAPYKHANNWNDLTLNFVISYRRERETVLPNVEQFFQVNSMDYKQVLKLDNIIHQTICDLQPYTQYIFYANTVNEQGLGTPSENLTLYTLPDVPKDPPTVELRNIYTDRIFLVLRYSTDTEVMRHDDIEKMYIYVNGGKLKTKLVYHYKYKPMTALITKMISFSLYNVAVHAKNSKGIGPGKTLCISTKQDNHPKSLPNFNVTSISSNSAQLKIGGIDEDEECVITKYVFHYSPGKKIEVNISHSEADVLFWNKMAKNEIADCSLTKPTSSKWVDITLENLTAYTGYLYHAEACCATGCSPSSAKHWFQTQPTFPLPIPSVNIYNISSTSLNASWIPLEDSEWNGPERKFELSLNWFSEEFQSEYIHLFVFPSDVTFMLFNYLEKYTNYTLFVRTKNSFGKTKAVVSSVFTDEDLPDEPPRLVNVTVINSTSVNVHIMPPLQHHINGILLGFQINYTSDYKNHTQRIIVKNYKTIYTHLMTNLRKFTNFSVTASLFNRIGCSLSYENLTFQTFADIPEGAPIDFTVANVTNDSAIFSWKDIDKDLQHGVMISCNICFSAMLANNSLHQECSALLWDRFDVIMNITIFNLFPHTTYTSHVFCCNTVGCGENATVYFTTNEMRPGKAVSNLQYCNNKILIEAICLSWSDLPEMDKRGHISNFVGSYKLVNSSGEEAPFQVSNNILFIELRHLLNHTAYYIKLSAATMMGSGPVREAIFWTKQNVPNVAPSDLIAFNTSSSSLHVKFNEIPDVLWEGKPMGYKLEYRRTEVECVNENICSPWNVIVLNGTDNTSCNLTNLGLHTNYSVRVSGVTGAGVGVQSPIIFVETDTFVDGGWSFWSGWGFCDRSCGGGKISRYRYCINPEPANGGAPCNGSAIEYLPCNIFPCQTYYLIKPGKDCDESCSNIDPLFTCVKRIITKDSMEIFRSSLDFENMPNEANLECASGALSHYSSSKHPFYRLSSGECLGYIGVPSTVQCQSTESIETDERRICFCGKSDAIFYGTWSTWSECSKTCGIGKRVRRRNCYNELGCPYIADFADCNTNLCPVHGEWGIWGEWTKCDVTCGSGRNTRYRSCNKPSPAHGGDYCFGRENYQEFIFGCNPQNCPIDGEWTEWDTNVYCSQACGENGVKRYTRKCTRPAPQFGGNYCPGNNLNPIPCNRNISCTAITVTFKTKLVDKEWTFRMFYIQSAEARNITMELSQEFKSSAESGNLSNAYLLHVNQLMKGSVIANFTVFFNASPYADIINIQEMIENVGFIGNLQVQPIDVTSVDVPLYPGFVNASSSSPFTITVEWSPVDQTNGEFYLYYVFYRTLDEPWLNVGSENTSLVLKDLIPDAFYFIRVLAAAIHGNGIATRQLRISTQAGVPSSKPPSLYHQIIDARTVYLGWNEIPESDVPGRLSGYKITYRKYKENFTITLETIATIPQITLKNLKPNTMYWAEVRGFTRAGVGPNDVVVFKTPPTAPEIAPPKLLVEDRYSVDSIALSWEPIPVDLENGYLIGYKIVYYLTRYRDEEVASREETTILVDRFTYAYRFERLLAYAQYRFEICGYTKEGEGPVETVEGRTCKCPEFIHTNFYSLPPYITPIASETTVNGVFSSFIEDVAARICIDCLSYTKPTLRFDGTMDGFPSHKSGEIEMITNIGDNVQISLPVHGRFNEEVFTTGHPYIGVVRSQGSAMIVYHEPIKSTDIMKFFAVITSLWPLILTLLLAAVLFAILFWFTEQTSLIARVNIRSVRSGFFEALWMMIVTMTTVGYGDFVPTSKLSRMLMVVWILFGVVGVGIFVGSVTTGLTSSNLSEERTLYGTKTAALVDTYELKLALKRNAVIERNFTSVIDIFDAIRNKTVEVGLIDSVVLAEYLDEMSTMNIKVDKIIDTNSGYGVVLSGGLGLIAEDFRSFVLAKQNYVEDFLASKVKRLQVKLIKSETELISKADLVNIIIMLCWCFLGSYVAVTFLWLVCSYAWEMKKKRQVHNMTAKDSLLCLTETIELFCSNLRANLTETEQKHSDQLKELCIMKLKQRRFMERMDIPKEKFDNILGEKPKVTRDVLKKYKDGVKIHFAE